MTFLSVKYCIENNVIGHLSSFKIEATQSTRPTKLQIVFSMKLSIPLVLVLQLNGFITETGLGTGLQRRTGSGVDDARLDLLGDVKESQRKVSRELQMGFFAQKRWFFSDSCHQDCLGVVTNLNVSFSSHVKILQGRLFWRANKYFQAWVTILDHGKLKKQTMQYLSFQSSLLRLNFPLIFE